MAKFESTCCECGTKFDLTADTAELTFYQNDQRMSWLATKCPNCGDVGSAFVAAEKFARLQADGIPVDTDIDDPPAAVQNFYFQNFPADEPARYDLSPRMEAEIAHLAAVLDAAPADAIMDLFSGPPPKSYLPERWI